MSTDERAIQSKRTSPFRLPRRVGVAVLLILALLLPGRALAATVTWDGGCGADTDWSCAANWSGNTPPGPVDVAYFGPGSGAASTVDPGFGGVVGSVKMIKKYAGIVSLARSLTVTMALSQQGGTFAANGQTLALKTVTIGGGKFEASSGVTSIDGSLRITGATTFDSNGGTVLFGGVGASLICNGVAFAHVVFSHTVGTKTIGPDCVLPLGDSPIAGAGGTIKLKGALVGSGTLTTTSKLLLEAGSSLKGFSGLVASTLADGGTHDFTAYAPFSVAKEFILKEGASFTAPVGIASFAGNFTIKPGATFDPNGGAVVFDGAAGGKLYCANQPFHLVRFAHTAGRKIVGADCSLPLGNDPTLGGGEGSVTLSGAFSGSGTLTAMQLFILNPTASLIGFGGFVAAASLYANGAVADFGSYGRFEVAKSYVQTGGTVTVPAGTSFDGQFVLNRESTFNSPPTGSVSFAERFAVSASASFNPFGSTTVFDGTASASIACGLATFNRVVFAHTAGTKTVSSSCDLPLGEAPSATAGGSITLNGFLSGTGTLATSGTLTLGEGSGLSGFSGLEAQSLTANTSCDFGSFATFSLGGNLAIGASGTFTAPEGTASVGGDFTNGGNFVANDGSVVLNGSDQALSGSTTFNRLTKVASGSATLTFAVGSTMTIGGKLTMLGASYGKLLKLASSVVGKAWRIDPEGEVEVSFLSVGDSTNLGAPIVASESFNGGGNTRWVISGPAASLALEAQTTTPAAGATDNLTIAAKDAYGNTATSYTGSHNLTFGPVSDSPSGAHAAVTDSSGTAVNFATATPIAFSNGLATVSGAKNGAMTLVKAGSASLTVTDGSISNGAGLAVTVSPGAAKSLALEAQTTTPAAGATDNLTIAAKDAYGNTATSYTGSHNLTFGPVSDSPSGAHAAVTDSSGTAVNFATATPIAFSNGLATVSGAKNGAMTLVKAGSASLTVTDGSISNGAGLAVTVSPGVAERIAWTKATVSKGTLSSPCLFTCTGTELSNSGNFKANVSITDSSGNTMSALGSGKTVSVTSASGTITGGTLTIAASGQAESTTQFTYTSSKGGAVTLTAATASGTVYTSATATMSR
jgi:hypothetical protein